MKRITGRIEHLVSAAADLGLTVYAVRDRGDVSYYLAEGAEVGSCVPVTMPASLDAAERAVTVLAEAELAVG